MIHHFSDSEDLKYLFRVFGMENLLQYLEGTDFFTAPASSKYHLACSGGLVQHTINVINTLEWLTLHMDLEWEKQRSPIIVGLLHDICKADTYKKSDTGYIYSPTGKYTGNKKNNEHGSLSVKIAQDHDVILTQEEILCIHYHMGAWTDDELEGVTYNAAVHQCPNVLWTHTADMYASQVMED